MSGSWNCSHVHRFAVFKLNLRHRKMQAMKAERKASSIAGATREALVKAQKNKKKSLVTSLNFLDDFETAGYRALWNTTMTLDFSKVLDFSNLVPPPVRDSDALPPLRVSATPTAFTTVQKQKLY